MLGYSAATWDEEEGEDASQEDAPPSTSTFEAGCDADMLATAAPTAAESVVVSADLPDGDHIGFYALRAVDTERPLTGAARA